MYIPIFVVAVRSIYVYIAIYVVVCPHSTRPAGGRNFAWHPSANGQPPPPRGLRCGGSLPIPPGAVMPAEHPPTSGVCSPFVRPRTPALTPLRGCAFTCSISEGGACHLCGRSLAPPKSATFLHSTCSNCTPSTPLGRVPPHGKQPPPLRPLGVGFRLATFCVSLYCALPQCGCYPLRFAYLRTNFQLNAYTPFSAL